MSSSIQGPKLLSDILGAAQIGDLVPVVIEMAAGTVVLERGSVISADATGKGVLTAAGNEASASGILLDEFVDTATPIQGKVTGSVARHGSFKANQLVVGVGTDLTKLVSALRQNGIYLEGAITVPLTTQEAPAAP